MPGKVTFQSAQGVHEEVFGKEKLNEFAVAKGKHVLVYIEQTEECFMVL